MQHLHNYVCVNRVRITIHGNSEFAMLRADGWITRSPPGAYSHRDRRPTKPSLLRIHYKFRHFWWMNGHYQTVAFMHIIGFIYGTRTAHNKRCFISICSIFPGNYNSCIQCNCGYFQYIFVLYNGLLTNNRRGGGLQTFKCFYIGLIWKIIVTKVLALYYIIIFIKTIHVLIIVLILYGIVS